jgi:peptidoglycan/xylan/chitin deacetylase (PgdA/CDA1 family)
MRPYFIAVDYHYIGQNDRYPFPGIHGITPGELKVQLEELSKNFVFVGIRELCKAIKENYTLPDRCAIVTFDDGLREQVDEALPVLEKMGIPAIFFVNSAPYTEKKVSNVHKIQYLRATVDPVKLNRLLESAATRLFNLSLGFDGIGLNLPSKIYPYDDELSRIQKYVLNFVLTPERSEAIINEVFGEQCSEEELCSQLYMTEEQLCEIHHKHHALGLHGHSHVALAGLSDRDASREILLCKEVVEDIVGDKLDCLSYPYGYKQVVSYREEEISKRANLTFCFTMEMCFNRDVRVAPHLLGRVNNNEAPGHKDACFGFQDGNPVIFDTGRMGYHRTNYYSD